MICYLCGLICNCFWMLFPSLQSPGIPIPWIRLIMTVYLPWFFNTYLYAFPIAKLVQILVFVIDHDRIWTCLSFVSLSPFHIIWRMAHLIHFSTPNLYGSTPKSRFQILWNGFYSKLPAKVVVLSLHMLIQLSCTLERCLPRRIIFYLQYLLRITYSNVIFFYLLFVLTLFTVVDIVC